MAPKRKGGGTKGFLKTAVRAGAEQGADAAPQEAAAAVPQPDGDQSGGDAAPPPAGGSAEAPAVSQGSAASATSAPRANGATAAAAEHGKPSPGAEHGEGDGGGGGGGDKTRGQMLQRHKKVRCVLVLRAGGALTGCWCRDNLHVSMSDASLLRALQEAKALKDTAKKMGKKRKVGDMATARADY